MWNVEHRKLWAGVALSALAVSACAPEDAAEFEEGEAEAEQAETEQTSDEQADDTAEGADSDEGEDAEAEGEDAAESDNGEDTEGNSEDDVVYAEVDDPVTFDECEEAEESDEATVEWLDDVVIEEERHEGVESQTVEVYGEEVEIPGGPDLVIPERVGQAGCIIEYDAPANCLPAVEISAAYIPGVTISERSLDEVELPDGTVIEEFTNPEVRGGAERIEGESEDQVCQVEPEGAEEGDRINSVTRNSVTRNSLTQNSITQNSGTRNSVQTEGDRVNQMRFNQVRANQLRINQVRVNQDRLNSYRLDGTEHTERSGEDEISYTTEGDVLFDFGEHELRGDAESELDAIAEDIAELDEQDFTVEVEGHTDDVPTDDAYEDNYELSKMRAESVVDWLTENAGVDDDVITSDGLGEDHPRADNDSEEGREENRRVVITVTPEDNDGNDLEYESGDEESD